MSCAAVLALKAAPPHLPALPDDALSELNLPSHLPHLLWIHGQPRPQLLLVRPKDDPEFTVSWLLGC